MIWSCFLMGLDFNTCMLYARAHNSWYGMEVWLGAYVLLLDLFPLFLLFAIHKICHGNTLRQEYRRGWHGDHHSRTGRAFMVEWNLVCMYVCMYTSRVAWPLVQSFHRPGRRKIGGWQTTS